MAEGLLLNGRVHDWSDVEVRIMTLDLGKGLTSINYKIDKAKELQYAGGTMPHGVGYGHKGFSCDFTLTKQAASLFEAVAFAAGKDATDYAPFLISISFMEKSAGATGMLEQKPGIKTITLHDVDVQGIEESLDEGTMKVVMKYTALCGNVVRT